VKLVFLDIVIGWDDSGLRLSPFHSRVVCARWPGTWADLMRLTREVWPRNEPRIIGGRETEQ